jgi:hypothetical protein
MIFKFNTTRASARHVDEGGALSAMPPSGALQPAANLSASADLIEITRLSKIGGPLTKRISLSPGIVTLIGQG